MGGGFNRKAAGMSITGAYSINVRPVCSKWGLFKVTRGMAGVHIDRNGDSKYLPTTEELHDSRWTAMTAIVRHHTSAIPPPKTPFANYTVRLV